jgi:hypothetical protein
MKYLFLDDERMPSDVTWIHIERDVQWVIVRSYDEAVQWVLKNGFPDVISFDHDLGEVFFAGNYTDEKTGYDFSKWLIEYDMDTNSMPDNFEFTVHSKNPIGASNIQKLLDNYLLFK